MNELEVINICKRYSYKKTEGVIKSPVCLYRAEILSRLALPCPSLCYMCEAKYRTLGNG